VRPGNTFSGWLNPRRRATSASSTSVRSRATAAALGAGGLVVFRGAVRAAGFGFRQK